MAAPQSSPLPEAPTRGEAEGQFVPKANAFVSALEPFRQQLQAQADFVNERSTETEDNAALAQDASEMALSSANFAGDWSGLSGAFDVPTSVLHDDTYWQLLEDVSNIQDDEPGVSAAWAPINVARNVVLALPDITALRAASSVVPGQRFSVQGRDSADDGGWAEFVVEERDGTRDWFMNVHLDDGVHQARLLRGVAIENLTVLIPTDYESKQAALDDTYTKVLTWPGVIIDLLMEEGFQPTTGVRVSNGDYGHYRISSVDAVVNASASFSDDRFLECSNARAPTLNCLIDAQSNINRGCWYTNSSSGHIVSGGVNNVLERGLYVNNSVVDADDVVFRGAGQGGHVFGRAIWAARGARLTCERIDIGGHVGPEHAVYVSRKSDVHAAYFVCDSSAASHLVRVHRGSTFNAQDLDDVHGGSSAMFSITRASSVIVNGSTFTDVQGMFVDIQDASSSMSCDQSTITGAVGNDSVCLNMRSGLVSSLDCTINGFDIAATPNRGGRWFANGSTIGGQSWALCEGQRGAQIHLTNCTLSTDSVDAIRVLRGSQAWAFDTTVNGSPIATTDTNIGSFNQMTGSGIIWA